MEYSGSQRDPARRYGKGRHKENEHAGPGWLALLPESLHGSTTADALEAIVDLDFTALRTSSCRKDMTPLVPIREGSLIRAELGA